MRTDKGVQMKKGHIVFVGSKGSGKSSLYQCLKSPNPQVIDGPSCSILLEDWKPFNMECSPVAEECRGYFNENLSEMDFDATFRVWDICGHEPLWTIQQLCVPKLALFILVFNVRNLIDAKRVPQWVQMIQSKSPGAQIIIAASNHEISEDPGQDVLNNVKNLEDRVKQTVCEELAVLSEVSANIWVKSRIEKLERIVEKRPNVCSTVFPTSAVTGKGLPDLRRTILEYLFDAKKFPNVNKSLSEQEMELMKMLRPLHDGKRLVMSAQDYKNLTSELGIHNEELVTQSLESKGFLSVVNTAGTFSHPDTSIVITDPSGFANACAMVHRDENVQEFVNKLQKSTLVQRFWPTSTRPNDWTLRSAIDDVVSRGLIRESFLPLCWQVWNMNEDDITQLLPAMLKLGVLVDGAPKAGYEIELALSYFKNLSVTKRYYLPLLLKLPADPPAGVWPKETPNSTVTVEWQYVFQEGFCSDLTLCILAALKNLISGKTTLAHWLTGLIVRVGDVEVMSVAKDRVFQLTARCKVTNGNRQAINMAWAILAQFIHITESYLSNFPGLYYQFGSPSFISSSSKSIHHFLSDCVNEATNCAENLWLIPTLEIQKSEEMSVPVDLLAWAQGLADQSNLCVIYKDGYKDEAEVLGANLVTCGFDVQLAPSDKSFNIQRCSAVIMLITKSYTEDPLFEENIKAIEDLNKPLIGGIFDADLNCKLPHTADLAAGSGKGSSHIFNSEQLRSLVTHCKAVIYGTGDIEPLPESVTITLPVVSCAPTMETGQQPVEPIKKKHHVQFAGDHVLDDHITDSQIKPLAACTVAAAMVGAAAEHINLTRKASSAGMRAANATANVARAVAQGDADAATSALNDVVKIVDDFSNSIKQKDNGFGGSTKSKTCVIF